eukprot:1744710-Ditylum_brightwellii.AAC.1
MKQSLRTIKKVVNRALEKYKQALTIVASSELSGTDETFLIKFLKTNPQCLSSCGKALLNQTRLTLEFHKDLKATLPSKEIGGCLSVVPGYDKFLSDFCNLYSINENVHKSLVVCLLKGAITKMSGMSNPEFLVPETYWAPLFVKFKEVSKVSDMLKKVQDGLEGEKVR